MEGVVRTPRVGSWLLRLAFAVVLLGLVIRIALPAEGPGIVATLRSAWTAPLSTALRDFALATLTLGAAFWIGTLRYHGLLRAAGIETQRRVLLRAYLVGGFFNLVLPGAMMGDAYRVVDARRDTGRGSAVLGLLLLERLLSLAALGALALLALPALPAQAMPAGLLPALLALALALLVLPLLPLHAAGNRFLRSWTEKLRRFSPRAADTATRSLRAVSDAAARPAVPLQAFGWSLLNQGLPVAAVWILSWPLDAQVAWTWYVVIVPFVTLASLLPLSLGGTGVREALYVGLFGTLGMRAEVALSLSLSILAVALVWGLVGLALFALGRPQAPIAEAST